jgi:hypothetical protein
MKLIIMLFIISIVLIEAIYEGLEMKTKLTSKSIYSTIGHLLQLVWIGLIFYFGVYLSKIYNHPNEWINTIISYSLMRFVLFNIGYNIVSGLGFFYLGTVDIFDRLQSHLPPLWLMTARVVMLLWSIALITNLQFIVHN